MVNSMMMRGRDYILMRVGTRILAVLVVVLSAGVCRAAGVECLETFSAMREKVPGVTFTTWWPSGFRPTPQMCVTALLQGTIEKGDFEKVRNFYRSHYKALTTFYLISEGGDVGEAMQIGRLFRKYLVSTQTALKHGDFTWLLLPRDGTCKGEKCVCASACALIWFGAPVRYGTAGIHRPHTSDASFKSLSPAEAARMYKQVLDEMSRYSTEMEIPRAVFDTMVGTGSGEISWVDTRKDKDLERAPSFAEWADASCGRFSRMEGEQRFSLEKKKAEGRALNQSEEMLRQMLEEKEGTHGLCQYGLRRRAVDSSPAP